MKKSPLSTPSGSRGRQGYGWKTHNSYNRTGYGSVKSDTYQCVSSNGTQMKYGDDFLPLNVSSPLSTQKSPPGNWYGNNNRNQRYAGNGGHSHYRNNYHTTPKSNFNNSYSPYKHYGKQYHGAKKAYQKDAHRHIDISNYIDMKSFLEDPWAELQKKFDNSKATDAIEPPERDSPLTLDSYRVESKQDLDDSQLSQESKNSSLNTSLGLDDTDISKVSQAESSVDLQFDTVTVNEDSLNGTKESDVNSANAQQEDSVQNLEKQTLHKHI